MTCTDVPKPTCQGNDHTIIDNSSLVDEIAKLRVNGSAHFKSAILKREELRQNYSVKAKGLRVIIEMVTNLLPLLSSNLLLLSLQPVIDLASEELAFLHTSEQENYQCLEILHGKLVKLEKLRRQSFGHNETTDFSLVKEGANKIFQQAVEEEEKANFLQVTSNITPAVLTALQVI